MKSSKSQIHAKFHRIPTIRFEHLNLKQRLKRCFSHLKIFPIFGHHLVVMLLIVHLLLGFRRLREVDYYRHRIIQRAGRISRPQGNLTLTMSANQAVRKDLLHFLGVLQKAA